MTNNASRMQIVTFLNNAKALVSIGHYDFVPRRKSLQSLVQYGITLTDAKDEILGLVVSDYYKGPKQDFNQTRPGDIWEFKKDISGVMFYIKLKIVFENGNDVLKWLGFHEDDFS